MEEKTIEVIKECVAGSHNETLRFGEIVGKLAGAGVAQYHADLFRAENTYYLTNEESLVMPLVLPNESIAGRFSSEGITAAVQASQQGDIGYAEFLSRAFASGCIGYVVYFTGQRVVYVGRQGDMHIEYFPSSK